MTGPHDLAALAAGDRAALRALTRAAALAPQRPPFEIRAAADDVPELLFYDAIGFEDGEVEATVREIDAIDAPEIRVRINSPGGIVFAGLPIYNALRRNPARIEVHVDGIAASIASVIAMAGDRIVMAEGAFFMIHEAAGIVIGGAADMRHMADALESITGELAAVYQRRTGLPRAEIMAMLAAETWMTAETAVEKGFADESAADGGAAENRFDLSIYDNVPAPAEARYGAGGGVPWPSKRAFEQHLRDAGCTAHAAKAIAAGGFKEPDRRDDVGDHAGLAGALRDRRNLWTSET